MVDAAGRMRRDAILLNALSIAAATGLYAISYGVLAVAAGFSVAQTCALSLLAFTGASQFSFVAVTGAGGGLVAALAPSVLLAARNGIYALTLDDVLHPRRRRRALEAQLVIDETTAMAHAQAGPEDRRRAFLTTGVLLFACWNGGTLLGALLGNGIDPEAFGLDALFPAVFLALLAAQLRDAGATRAALLGAVIALALVPFTPVGVPLLAATLGCVASLRRRAPR